MNKISRRANRERCMEHVRAWRKSGLRQAAYCRHHGLVAETFNAWVSRVKRATAEPASLLTILPVVVQTAAGHIPSTSAICLQHHSGWQLQLPGHVEASWLGNVRSQLR